MKPSHKAEAAPSCSNGSCSTGSLRSPCARNAILVGLLSLVLLPTAVEGRALSQRAQSVKEYLMDLSFLRNAFGGNNNTNQARPSWQDVPVSAANQRKQEFRLIDVREPGEFSGDLGHIQGAELVPLATLATAAKSWNTETPILVICRSGGRSSRGSELLASMGFSKVHNMAGGMLSWNAAGLPVVR